MIIVYGMPSCPDCAFLEEQLRDKEQFRMVDIGANVRELKDFLRLRDTHPVFEDARENGYVGIPCFVLEDGTVSLSPEDLGLRARE